MEKGTWRNLMLAAAAGVAAYVACAVWGPWPAPRVTLSEVALGADLQRLELSPDASLVSAAYGTPSRWPRWQWDWRRTTKTQVFRTNVAKMLIEDKRYCVFAPMGGVFALHDHDTVECFDVAAGEPVLRSKQKVPLEELQFICIDDHGQVFYCYRYAIGCYGSLPVDLFNVPRKVEVDFGRDVPIRHLGRKWVASATLKTPDEYFVCDMTTGERISKFLAAAGFGRHVLSDNGCSLIIYPETDGNTSTSGPTIHDLASGGVRKLPFEGEVSRLSPDGKIAACSSYVDSAPTWLQKLKSFLVVGGAGSETRHGVTLADMETGQELAFFAGARLPCFSADGRTLALLNRDGHIELWDLPLKSAVPPMVLIATVVTLFVFLLLRRDYRRQLRPEGART